MTPWTLDFESVAWQWWWWISEATWQSALPATALLALALFARRWPSPVRHGLLIVALVKFAVPPVPATSAGLFPWLAESLPVVTETAPSKVPEGPPFGMAGSMSETEIGNESTAAMSAAVSTTQDWRGGLMLLHFVGIGLTLLFIGHQYGLLRRLISTARPIAEGELGVDVQALAARLGLRRIPCLLASPRCSTPSAFGLLRPTVLLPETVLESEDVEAVEVTLAHEMAHLRRGDPWINTLQIALLAVWWWNPVYHLLSRSIRRLREECCDDLLLASGITDGRRYCGVLLRLADRLATRRDISASLPSPALGLAEQLHPLGHRLRRLMDFSLGRAPGLSRAAALLLVTFGLMLLPGRSVVGNGGGAVGEEIRKVEPIEAGALARSEVRRLWPAAVFHTVLDQQGAELRVDRFELDGRSLSLTGRVSGLQTMAERLSRLGDASFTKADLETLRKVGEERFEFQLRLDRQDPALIAAPEDTFDPAPWRRSVQSDGRQKRTLVEMRQILSDHTVRLKRFVPEPSSEGAWGIVAHFSADDAGFSAYLRSMATSIEPMVFDRLVVERQDDGELKAEGRILVPKSEGEPALGSDRISIDAETLKSRLEALYDAAGGDL